MSKLNFSVAKNPAPPTRGQSLVEFALAATLMIFLLVATIDFGLAFFSWITLRDAAQEGAVYGAMFPPISSTDAAPISQIQARVRTAATTPVDLSNLPLGQIEILVTDTGGNWNACAGNAIRVQVTYNYRIITPMISNFTGSPTIPVTAAVTNTLLRHGNGATCP